METLGFQIRILICPPLKYESTEVSHRQSQAVKNVSKAGVLAGVRHHAACNMWCVCEYVSACWCVCVWVLHLVPVIIRNPHITLSGSFQEKHTKNTRTERWHEQHAIAGTLACLSSRCVFLKRSTQEGQSTLPSVKVNPLSDTSNMQHRIQLW